MTVDDQRRPERVRFVVLAAYRRFPGCCMEPVEVGQPMARTTHGHYVHAVCAPECLR